MEKINNFFSKYEATCYSTLIIISALLNTVFTHSRFGLILIIIWSLVSLLANLLVDNYANRAETTVMTRRRRVRGYIAVALFMLITMVIIWWYLSYR